MEFYLSKKLPNLEPDKIKINKDHLLKEDKNKNFALSPNKISSYRNHNNDNKTEGNKLIKSIQNKHNYLLFKNALNDKSKEKFLKLKQVEHKALSLDKKEIINNIKKFQFHELKSNELNDIENNSKKENGNKELKTDNNIKLNNNFFRLFKNRKKNKIIKKGKESVFPTIINYNPIEIEKNVINRNKNSSNYNNLYTSQNEDISRFKRNAFYNSLNKNKSLVKEVKKLNIDKKSKINLKFYNNFNKNRESKEIIFPRNREKSNLISLTDEKISNKLIKGINIGNLKDNKISTYKDNINIKSSNKKLKLVSSIDKKILLNRDKVQKNNNLTRKFTPNYKIKIITRNNVNSKSKKSIKFNNIIKTSKEAIQNDNIDDSFRDELNIIISGVNNYGTEKKKNSHDKPKTIDNFKGKKIIDNFKQDNIDCTDDMDIDININIENINDESEEKSIPKENEEKINLMKQYKRPITSYAFSKT